MLDPTTVSVLVAATLLGYWFLRRKISKLPPGIGALTYRKLELLNIKYHRKSGIWTKFRSNRFHAYWKEFPLKMERSLLSYTWRK